MLHRLGQDSDDVSVDNARFNDVIDPYVAEHDVIDPYVAQHDVIDPYVAQHDVRRDVPSQHDIGDDDVRDVRHDVMGEKRGHVTPPPSFTGSLSSDAGSLKQSYSSVPRVRI